MSSETANERDATKGLGSIYNPVKYLDQDYEQLKAECLAAGTLFEDPEFPAEQSSLGVKKLGPKTEAKYYTWKRPTELYENPHFIIEGATQDDIHQGRLGDCWFLASVASLTMNSTLLHQVIPENQSFQTDYAGIFHFVIWYFGQWMSIVVDDRLPIKDGRLAFLRTRANEYWCALLEKAYAKLYGCYEALSGGHSSEAMTDLTAGVSEVYYTDDDNLLTLLRTAFEKHFLISCGTDDSEPNYVWNLAQNHAYTITGMKKVICYGTDIQLIRLRNPWGFFEWKGPWSDDAPEWKLIDPEVKAIMNPKREDGEFCGPEWDQIDPEVKAIFNLKCEDGEFWMSFSDFTMKFYIVMICNISLSKEYCGEDYQWHRMQFNGNWTGDKLTSGLLWTNPKIRFKLQDPDEEDKCNIVVSLMQKGQREKKPAGYRFFAIRFYIFEIIDDEKIGREFFKTNEPVGKSKYLDAREVARPFKLPPGDYVIVAVIEKTGAGVDFCLRIFAKKPFQAEQLDDTVYEDPVEVNFVCVNVPTTIL